MVRPPAYALIILLTSRPLASHFSSCSTAVLEIGNSERRLTGATLAGVPFPELLAPRFLGSKEVPEFPVSRTRRQTGGFVTWEHSALAETAVRRYRGRSHVRSAIFMAIDRGRGAAGVCAGTAGGGEAAES